MDTLHFTLSLWINILLQCRAVIHSFKLHIFINCLQVVLFFLRYVLESSYDFFPKPVLPTSSLSH